jgi:hypothetical protein
VHYHTPQNYTISHILLTPITPYRSDEERGLLLHKLWYSDVQRWVGELLLSVYRAVHTAVWADEIEGNNPHTKLPLFSCFLFSFLFVCSMIIMHVRLHSIFIFPVSFYFSAFVIKYLYSFFIFRIESVRLVLYGRCTGCKQI